ncbi:C-type lectin domain family 18 member A-like [Hyla sarda]|uniref:C-type lectin domain family 18 member A-like n=1 Tax=Hyla sarda TaxID=327740 RepID=UPI0024C31860|nr:C-type lectin domain family 18 member A-like [Hyla sarda]
MIDAADDHPGTGPDAERRRERFHKEEIARLVTTSQRDMSVCGLIARRILLGIFCIVGTLSEQLSESTQRLGFGDMEKFKLVSVHNKLRGNVRPPAANMRRMSWSESLEARALEVAYQCLQNAPDDPEVGWNLQSFPVGIMTFREVITLWFRQRDNYNFQTSECTQNQTCHHYTQLVWASSWELGCGMSQCSSEMGKVDMFVCAYGPGGNWDIGGHIINPYQSGPSCSMCTASWSGCFTSWEHRGGLCEVPRNPCRINCGDHGTLNMSSCQCDCAKGYTGRLCQVRCAPRCLHGQYKALECSCICDSGYRGAECTEEVKSAQPCDLLSDGVCFKVSSDVRPYYKAKKICQESGGHLAEIRTQKIQDILAFYLGQLGDINEVEMDRHFQTQNFWIGLTYKSRFSFFRWDSGVPVSFQSFALGQPDNAGFSNCVEMMENARFNWNDQHCKTHNRYICQYKT